VSTTATHADVTTDHAMSKPKQDKQNPANSKGAGAKPAANPAGEQPPVAADAAATTDAAAAAAAPPAPADTDTGTTADVAAAAAPATPGDRALDQPVGDTLPKPGKREVLSEKKFDGQTIRVVTDGVRTWKEGAE
jgi:hypothetical protein